MFAHRDSHGQVDVAFTDRHGGTSGGPFASLNLAEPSGDVPGDEQAAVARNLERVATAFAGGRRLRRVVRLRQVHGADVHVVDEDSVDLEDVPAADGAVTTLPGVALMVRVADCVPVLLADPDAGVVGAAHAGRPGLGAGVVPATVQAMRERGAERIRAWLGPHVCGACYEVPEVMRDEVAARVPSARAVTSWGTPALDLGAGVLAQLEAEGVLGEDVSRCTLEDDDLYSYRRDGRSAGRLAGLVCWWP